jgi:hypothetical protein
MPLETPAQPPPPSRPLTEKQKKLLLSDPVSGEPLPRSRMNLAKVALQHLVSVDFELIGTTRTVTPIGPWRLRSAGSWDRTVNPFVFGVRQPHTEMVLRGLPSLFWAWDAQRMVGVDVLYPPSFGSVSWFGANSKSKPTKGMPGTGNVFALASAKLDGQTGKPETLWQKDLGEIWALALAGDVVVAGGPVYPETVPVSPALSSVVGAAPGNPLQIDPLSAKGRAHVVSAADGRPIATVDLPGTPVQDGVAIAGGKIYFACVDGSIVCLE